MINEEVIDDMLDELDECVQEIQSLKRRIKYIEKLSKLKKQWCLPTTDDNDIQDELKYTLVNKEGDYRIIQELLCVEYEKLEIETIKTHLHG